MSTVYSQLRREHREATESYFQLISEWNPDAANRTETLNDRARRVARISVKLHFFEQGQRAQKRKARAGR